VTAAEQNVLKAYHAKDKYNPFASNGLIPTLEIAVVETGLHQSVRWQNEFF